MKIFLWGGNSKETLVNPHVHFFSVHDLHWTNRLKISHASHKTIEYIQRAQVEIGKHETERFRFRNVYMQLVDFENNR